MGALGVGLAHQDGHAHLELGRLDGHRQAGVEAAGQALVDVHQPLGVGVAGHDDVRALGQQRLEGVEELLLRAVLAGEELHVVDQQQVQRVVLGLQLVEGLALVVLDHVADELLGVQVQHAGIRPVLQQRVAHRVDQVRLAQAHAAVDEQRVVHVHPGAPATCSAAVRAIWLARPAHQGVEGRGPPPAMCGLAHRPDRWFQRARGAVPPPNDARARPATTWICHETHLSSIEDPPRPHPRFPGAHEDPWWPCRDQRTPRQGPQAPGRLSWLSPGTAWRTP
jgi:hypothetical protein